MYPSRTKIPEDLLPKSALPLALFLFTTSIIDLGVPSASAIGCPPNMGDFDSVGPYPSSLEGFIGLEDKYVTARYSLKVLTVEPGVAANMTYGYAPLSSVYPPLRPVIRAGSTTQNLSEILSWLTVSFDPEIVNISAVYDADVAVTFRVSEDAPLGEYELTIEGEPVVDDEWMRVHCRYAPLSFILKVAHAKTKTVTVTQTVSTTITSAFIKTTTVTSTLTGTTSTVLTGTLTRTATQERAQLYIYAWAVGATIIAIGLATVLTFKKRI